MNIQQKSSVLFYKVLLGFVSLTLLFIGFAQAEPWISNRFAQNCAACHAPGRTNRPAKGRRCTLSCQGCHVNPQGGGLRNTYGKWNSQRWLRSFNSKTFHGEKTPAPLVKQPYAKRVKKLGTGKKLTKKELRTPPHAVISQTHPPEKYYDKFSWSEWTKDVDNESQFLAIIPREDPYRLERSLSHYAGADVRYFYGDYKVGGLDTQDISLDGFMAIDLGLRVRPTTWHKLSFVLEPRIQDPANDYAISSIDSTRGYLKSAYVLVDDLSYNSFVQFGNYRPLFGNMNVSHISLSQDISGFSGRPTFRTLSFGTAPNIPFLIINYIMSSDAHGQSEADSLSGSTLGNDDDGLVISFGGRWVTLGLSTKLSYWSSHREGTGSMSGEKRKWNMYSLTAGGTLGPLIANLEMVRVERDRRNADGSDAGNVSTIEAKIRAWKEAYITSSYSVANTTSYLTKGNATEMTYGLKFFPISGFEFEVLVSSREEKFKDTNNKFNREGTLKIDLTALQLHAYF